MRYTRGFTVVEIVVVIMVVGLLVGAGFVWLNRFPGSKGESNKVVKPAVSPMPTMMATSDTLLSYADSKLGISFTYPKNWVIKKDLQTVEGFEFLSVSDKNGQAVMNFNNFGFPLDCGDGIGSESEAEQEKFAHDVAAKTHIVHLTIGSIPVEIKNFCGGNFYWKDMQSSKGYVAVDVSKAVDLDRGVVKAEYAKPLDELLRSVRGLSLQN